MKYWKNLFTLLISMNVLLSFAIFKQDDSLHLVFCDVGQGDGILIYQKSTQIIIDGGPDRKMLTCLGKHLPFYDRTIEYVVLTNSDLDHYGGLIDIFERYKVLGYGTSGVAKADSAYSELDKVIKQEGIKTTNLSSVNTLAKGTLSLKTIWPEISTNTNEPMEGKEVNERSLVMELRYGSFKALLTGDIVPPATNSIISLASNVDVLKVPHHGSKNGLTQELLEVTNPKLAVISAGKNNRYGHPHTEILEMLNSSGIKTLRTDEKGEIHFVIDRNSWSLK